jgi:hypothetical protein
MEKCRKNMNNYNCESCDYTTGIIQNYNKHLLTPKHKININNDTLAISGNKKVSTKYSTHNCSYCNYNTNNKSHYNKHLLSEKHKNNCIIESEGEQPKEIKHICSQCNKEYLNYNALWKHSKKCVIVSEPHHIIEPPELQNTLITSDLFLEVLRGSKELQNVLIEQNKELQHKLLEKESEFQNKLLEKESEFQNILIEQNKQIIELAKNQSVVNNNNNTTNNQFNLQVYLNETCKDAMNIVDFVNSVNLTTEDFETTGKLGFVNGISRIFIKELKKLDTEKLPIHCTDFKRETVYIKDNDTWEKETDEKKRVKWAIDSIAQLNLNQIQQWQEKFPECRENNTPANEKFFGLARVALGGQGKEEEDKFREKIMRNVLKEVVLDKKSSKWTAVL